MTVMIPKVPGVETLFMNHSNNVMLCKSTYVYDCTVLMHVIVLYVRR